MYYHMVLQVQSPKIKVLAELHSFWRLWGRFCFLVFSSYWKLPAFLGSWSFSSTFKAISVASLNISPSLCFWHHISFSDWSSCLPSYKDLVITVGPRNISPAQAPNLITATKSLLPCQVIHLQVLWVSWGVALFRLSQPPPPRLYREWAREKS